MLKFANYAPLKIRIRNQSRFGLPQYQTKLSAGSDICADISEEIILRPGERQLIPSGLYIELPDNCEAQIRPRSGLALKYGITVLNAPGTIDADYRGEIKVLLINLGQEDFCLKPGDRIAQMVIAPFVQAEWTETDLLSSTERGSGGYGHTGTQSNNSNT